jgi:precorrin-6B methylase 2
LVAVAALVIGKMMQTKHYYFAIACCIVLPLLCGCATTNYGDNQFKLSMASLGKDVMWVPTKVEMADQMLALAQVRPGDRVYDLGSGDGVIPIEAAKKYQVRAVGIEYNPDLVKLSQRNAERAKVENLVTFKQGDIFVEDFSQSTVLTLFLGENLNTKLMPSILKMQAGTRVVSNTFPMESWIPDQEVRISNGEMAYLWVVPANVDGSWQWNGPPGLGNLRLVIRQKKQYFDGALYRDNKQIALFEDGRIRGSDLEFVFAYQKMIYVFKGRVNGLSMTGNLNNNLSLTVSGKR